ncbi:MAG: hypothetical protein KDA69_21480, partial [Planctomycetaceae bacterium]|nr:hypothetical protein [Planctomycetaceae bacterium]
PYRVDLSEETEQDVEIIIRNFRSTEQQHRVALVLPEGVVATPVVLEGSVPPESRQKFTVKLRREAVPQSTGVQLIPFDITLDGKRYGQLFDFLVRLPEKP